MTLVEVSSGVSQSSMSYLGTVSEDTPDKRRVLTGDAAACNSVEFNRIALFPHATNINEAKTLVKFPFPDSSVHANSDLVCISDAITAADNEKITSGVFGKDFEITPEKLSNHMSPYLYRLLKNVCPENSGGHGISTLPRRKRTLSSCSISPQDKENIPDAKAFVTSPSFIDGDSQDSGFCSLQLKKEKSATNMIEHMGCPPRKLKSQNIESSLAKLTSNSSGMNSGNFSMSSCSSLGICADLEEDDGFADVFEAENYDEDTQMPFHLKSLITEKLKEQNGSSALDTTTNESISEVKKHPGIRRCLSLAYGNKLRKKNREITQSGSPSLPKYCSNAYVPKEKSHDFTTNSPGVTDSTVSGQGTSNNQSAASESSNDIKPQCSFKSYTSDLSNDKPKKSVTFMSNPYILSQVSTPRGNSLKRCLSESEATIMRAVQKSSQDPNLIGDFSRAYILPLIAGKHQDIKTIASKTMMELLRGDYEKIDNYVIVDCRYPYEYQGGHIVGSKNIFTKEGIIQEFLSDHSQQKDKNQCNIIIFHCEFSSERAPKLYRFLRNKDREANNDCYPSLFHPEMYVLHGGYKAFYESYKVYCEPQEYKPMLHKDHESDLRHFRAKSKSWSCDYRTKMCVRPGLNF